MADNEDVLQQLSDDQRAVATGTVDEPEPEPKATARKRSAKKDDEEPAEG